jgi:phospholipid/cholesterol/gamma-HCH transport system permease protein
VTFDRFRAVLAIIGRPVTARSLFLARLAAQIFGVLREAPRPWTWRRTVRREFARSLHHSIAGGLLTTLGAAALIGLALVGQAIFWLGSAGEGTLIGPILVAVLVREVTPLIVGFLLLGRTGTVILAELGTVRLAGQIDVLEAQGIDPFLILVLPRAVATALSAFTLGMMFILAALMTGFVTGSMLGQVSKSLPIFLDTVVAAMRPVDFALFPIKMVSIGMLVSLVCSSTALSADRDDALGDILARGLTSGVLAVMVTSVLLSLAA